MENSEGFAGFDLSALSGLLNNPEIISKLSGVLSGLGAIKPSDPAPGGADIPQESAVATSDAADSQAEATVATPAANQADDTAGKLGALLSNGELISKLPDVIAAFKPLSSGDGKPPDGKHGYDKRIALLIALKPYMSHRRRETIDYLVRINKLGDVIRTIK